jgi:hypothetical protein
MDSNKKTARIAGLWYLLMAVFSSFSMVYLDSKFYVPGNATATVSKILASEWLYRLGLVSNLLSQICFLFLIYALYKLLKPVDKDYARLMALLVVVSIPIALVNVLNQFVPIILLSGSGYLSAFGQNQLNALVMFFLNLYTYGLFIAGIFWGLWLLPLGYLVIKSKFIPQIIGVFLIIAGLGYMTDSLCKFLIPNYNITIGSYTFIGEVLLIFWLLFKGVKVQAAA